jgi:methylmalonyl-CoA mutase N-terminal domain/subunit
MIESGQLHRKISSYFYNQQKDIEKGDIKIVAYNKYRSEISPPPINVFQYPNGVEERQREKLAKLRFSRDNDRAGAALAALKAACRKGENILPLSVACARARCTEGELFKVFKEAFGLWKSPALW